MQPSTRRAFLGSSAAAFTGLLAAFAPSAAAEQSAPLVKASTPAGSATNNIQPPVSHESKDPDDEAQTFSRKYKAIGIAISIGKNITITGDRAGTSLKNAFMNGFGVPADYYYEIDQNNPDIFGVDFYLDGRLIVDPKAKPNGFFSAKEAAGMIPNVAGRFNARYPELGRPIASLTPNQP